MHAIRRSRYGQRFDRAFHPPLPCLARISTASTTAGPRRKTAIATVRTVAAAAAVSLALLSAACPGAAEPSSCGDWNTRQFFHRAAPADVLRCLEAGAAPGARGEFGLTP